MSAASDLHDNGFVHVPRLVPEPLTRALVTAFLEEVNSLEVPLPRQHNAHTEPHERGATGHMVNPLHNPHLLELTPRFAQAAAALATFEPLVHTAAQLLDSPVALLQTAFYDSSRGSAAHRDDHPFRADAPMLGAWIALEDISEQAGPFVVFAGSHAIQDPELDRLGRRSWTARHVEGHTDAQANRAYQERLHHHIASQGPTLATVKRGDVVFWDRRTVHGSRPPAEGTLHSRRSLNAHYIRTADMP